MAIKYFFSLLVLTMIAPQNMVFAQEANQSIRIEQVEVQGYTVFDSETIEALVRPYRGKELTFEQLKQLTEVITDLYTNQGYTTSGAFFPQQDISKGDVKIQVVEGSLERIETEGLERLKENYINSRLNKVNPSPVNINELQKALEQLRLDPLIERVEATLVRGTSLNSSVLLVEIEEAKLISASFEFNNQASPTIQYSDKFFSESIAT